MSRRSLVARCVTFSLLAVALGLLSAPTVCPARAAEEGFQPIFDGQTLNGWEGDPSVWRVEDGAITGETTKERPAKHNTFLIWRKGAVDNFELRFEYRFASAWGNSGLQYRSWEAPDFVVRGYQADFETGKSFSGILYGEGFRGILAQRGTETVIGDDHKPRTVGKFGDSAAIQTLIKAGDWNSYRVTAKGFKFTHEINGQVTCVCTDEDQAQRRPSGIVALQVHAGPPMKVQFRNLQLKRLPPVAAK